MVIKPLLDKLLKLHMADSKISIHTPTTSSGQSPCYSNVSVDDASVRSFLHWGDKKESHLLSTYYGNLQGSGRSLAEAYLDLFDKIANPTLCVAPKAKQRDPSVALGFSPHKNPRISVYIGCPRLG
jgi:hypothetical protein